MKKDFFIGLDNGGSVTKAGLFDVDGKEIAVSSIAVEPSTPKINLWNVIRTNCSWRIFNVSKMCLKNRE